MSDEAESKKPKIVPKDSKEDKVSKATSKLQKISWEKIAYYLEDDEDENSHLYKIDWGQSGARLTFLDATNGHISVSYNSATGDLNFHSDASTELALRKMIQLLAKAKCSTVTLTAANDWARGIMESECTNLGLNVDQQHSQTKPQPKKHRSHHDDMNTVPENRVGLERRAAAMNQSTSSPFKKS